MKKYRPYELWTKIDFKRHFTTQLEHFSTKEEAKVGAPLWLSQIVYFAIDSKEWNPSLDFNGCSVIEDMLHPCMSCFIHDFLWHTGRGGALADSMFYDAMIFEGTPKAKAWFLWAGVRCVWFLWHKWKYAKKKKLRSDSLGVIIEEYKKKS